MIESETGLPVLQGVPVTTRARSRDTMRLRLTQAQRWIKQMAESPAAGRLRSAGLFLQQSAGQARLQTLPSKLAERLRAGVRDFPLLNRFALHLVVVCLAVGVVVVTQVDLPQIDFLLPTPTPGASLGGEVVVSQTSSRGGGRVVQDSLALLPSPVLHTTIPERQRTEVITYTVQANDNLWIISQQFALEVETLLWANPALEKDPDLLSVKQVLVVPPVDGVYYTVKKGDTVQKVAKTYKTTADQITGYAPNGLAEPYTLVTGQKLMLPGGQKPVPVAVNVYPMTQVGSAPKGAPKGSGKFAWPTRGYLSQAFWRAHHGIDIANRIGVAIVAADAGYVVMAGRDTWGYGNQVVIDHGNGFWTRYAHLDKILVTAGESVKKNQKIGTMGNTGRSTGPHLHFEVIKDKTQRNPLSYLP